MPLCLRRAVVVACFALLGTATVRSEPPPGVSALFRPAQYDAMSISPDGVHLAATVELEDRKVLVILGRESMRIRATIDPGKEGGVDSYRWLNNQRLMALTSRQFGQNAGRSTLPFWYAIDVDGNRPQRFNGAFVGLVPGDDKHILLAFCDRVVRGECNNEVVRFNTYTGRERETVAKAPLPDASFLADRKGVVRVAWGWDKDDRQRLFVRRGDGHDWRLVHDEASTGTELYPIGFNAALDRIVVQAEQREGPDAIESLNPESGERTALMRHARVDPTEFLWSADRSEPIGAVFFDGKPRSGFWSGQSDAALIRGIEQNFPGQRVIVGSRSVDGRWAVVSTQSDRDPGGFHLVDGTSGEMRLLTQLKPGVDSDAMRPMESASFQARDGTRLDVLVTRPRGAAPHPTVIMIHGGPYGIRDFWGFDSEVQALASQGYAVVQTNFRGSGGYGRAFLESGYREWGRAMQRDIADSASWAVAQGISRADRICALGTSYGGYAAVMALATDPALFRCAAGTAGPYDLGLLFEWGDIHRSNWGKKYLERVVGTDRLELAARSPVSLARKIKAPVLLAWGGRDGRVSPQHGEAMEAALRKAGNPPEVFKRDFEGHGLADTRNRIEYVEKLLSFLRKNLAATP